MEIIITLLEDAAFIRPQGAFGWWWVGSVRSARLPFLDRNDASCSSVWSAHGNVGTHTAGAFLVCVPEMPPIAHARG